MLSPFFVLASRSPSRQAAFRRAALSPWTGVANIGGGSRTTMNEVLAKISSLAGPVDVVRLPSQRGDVRHTAADTSVARQGFGFRPQVGLDEGLARMVAAARETYPATAPLEARP